MPAETNATRAAKIVQAHIDDRRERRGGRGLTARIAAALDEARREGRDKVAEEAAHTEKVIAGLNSQLTEEIACSGSLAKRLLDDGRRIAELEKTLQHYAETCCEGYCGDSPGGFEDRCSGCLARSIIAKPVRALLDTPSPAAQPETEADRQNRLIADYFGVTVEEVRRVRAGAQPATPADGSGE